MDERGEIDVRGWCVERPVRTFAVAADDSADDAAGAAGTGGVEAITPTAAASA